VIGAYSGRGRRRRTYGSLLCTAYNPEYDVFQTVCKLGTGFSDEELEKLPPKFKQHLRDNKSARAEVLKSVEPTYYFNPNIVVEVLGAELTKSPIHTCAQDEAGKGISLRFPRFIRWRPEKSAEEATTTTEILEMYQKQ
jgi:DNA ligase-1